MSLVDSALRRPFTILVAVVALIFGATLAVRQMPRDIFPTLGIPTIYVAQPYAGMDPGQMEGFLTYYYEYHFLYITGIEHVESKSIQGAAIIKLQFHPGTDMSQALSETVAYVNRARAFMPPGTVPPFITRFDAGSVPVGNLVFSSETRTVGELQDAALNRVRPLFATLPGVSAPPPFGGSARSIVIDLKPDQLRAYDMSPDEVVAAITAANTIVPSGNMTLNGKYPMVPLNAVVKNIKDLESVPIRPGKYPAIFVHDVATVTDGSDIITCYALVNGRRTVYIPVTKRSDASTLSVVELVKQNLPKFQGAVPDDVKVSYEFDQSPYVTRAIRGLTLEAGLGALLTGLMILLFLRDWRSVFIVVINIPLSLLGAILALWLTHQTINVMTLGGLALAVGILVDEATVCIENIHVHLVRGRSIARAALDATTETTTARLLAMLCILAIFTPAFFMTGAAKAMFVPLTLAVGFSMVISYLLSSTLVPVLSVWLLGAGKKHSPHSRPLSQGVGSSQPDAGPSMPNDVSGGYSGPYLTESKVVAWGFDLPGAYTAVAKAAVKLRWGVVAVYLIVAALVIVGIAPRLGTEIFPRVDAGQLQIRLRAPAGTHVTGTEAIALKALDLIKSEVGADKVEITLGFVGVHAPSYPINLIYLWNGGSEEGVIQVQLRKGAAIPLEPLKERLRQKLAQAMPDVSFSFEPSDIVSRVMSLGAATPIEVAVSGPSLDASRAFAETILERLKKVPSLRDVQLGQTLDYPTVDVKLNRERAGLAGVQMAQAGRSLVAATSSTRFTVPNYWADPNSGIAYQIQVQIPQARMNSVEELKNLPLASRDGRAIPLRNIASVSNSVTVGQYERYNMQRVVSVTANLGAEDLGTVSKQVMAAIRELGDPPPKVTVAVRGQVVPLEQMLSGLRTGLLLAILVIFLLLTANFQSLKLSFIVISTAPAVIAGVVLTLWLTGTTLNIESFMGAIMAVGVAVANAILLVTFAERSRVAGASFTAAAVEGARSRLRPILMTSLAMIVGMLPMALALGEGGEQTAPLGRAVVGGLVAATVATLFVLPAVFALVQQRTSTRSASLSPDDSESSHYAPERAEG